MPSVLSHPAVPISLAIAAGEATVSRRLLAAGIVCSVLPDADAVGFWLGIPYEDTFGHRGFSHSLSFAVLLAVGAALLGRFLRAPPSVAFAFVLASAASHGLLDALTSGGLGVAFFSPFSDDRYFFPWRPIAVSPIGVSRFFSARGLRILRSEALLVWLPCAIFAALAVLARTRRARA